MSTDLFKFRTFLFLASCFRVLSLSFSSQVLGSCPWLFSMFCITLSYLRSVVCTSCLRGGRGFAHQWCVNNLYRTRLSSCEGERWNREVPRGSKIPALVLSMLSLLLLSNLAGTDGHKLMIPTNQSKRLCNRGGSEPAIGVRLRHDPAEWN